MKTPTPSSSFSFRFVPREEMLRRLASRAKNSVTPMPASIKTEKGGRP